MDNDKERSRVGWLMVNAHAKNGGQFNLMTFKGEDRIDDDPIGPLVVYAEGCTPGPRPIGEPDPEGMFYLGWQCRSTAERLSRDQGVPLTIT